IFLHDDVYIHDVFWTQKIEEALTKYDVVGLAGCQKRKGVQPSWYFENIEMNTIPSEQASGIISHGNELQFNTTYFGPSDQRVEILDGLLIAVKLSTLRKHKIRFDERFKFHFYDVDFCRVIEEKKLSCGTVPISVIHKSDGVYDEIWRQSFSKYEDKWAFKK
ncbi:glycosyltransferase, partial [Paracoccaceae bacterium]|nr:glycosyltransferase [Paracoccaceae bacterium]